MHHQSSDNLKSRVVPSVMATFHVAARSARLFAQQLTFSANPQLRSMTGGEAHKSHYNGFKPTRRATGSRAPSSHWFTQHPDRNIRSSVHSARAKASRSPPQRAPPLSLSVVPWPRSPASLRSTNHELSLFLSLSIKNEIKRFATPSTHPAL